MRVGEREILVVVTQCLLLLTRSHHSYTYYSYRIIRWELNRSYGSRAPSRSYAVSAPANPVASQQYCYIIGELILHCRLGEWGGGDGGGIRDAARLLTMFMVY